MNNYIKKARSFLEQENIDYLLVNSTNEFLVEYNELPKNSRYFLTGFSGSTGEALVSNNAVYLFVDGRYHVQADMETAKTDINVVKLQMSDNMTNAICERIKNNSTLAICAKKVSQSKYEEIQEKLNDKNITIKPLNFDPVNDFKNTIKQNISEITIDNTGKTSKEKIQEIAQNLKNNEAAIITNLEDLSYIYNIRNFNKQNSCAVEGKAIITKSNNILFKDETLDNFESYITSELKNTYFYVDKKSISAYDFSLLKDRILISNKTFTTKNIKTEKEIEHYIQAFANTDKAINATRDFINNNSNLSEYDIKTELENNFKKFGAISQSFNSIVAIDENSAIVHYSGTSKEKILKDGSIVLIDCGGYYDGGLATDTTRVFVKGQANKEQQTIYTLVLKAFLKSLHATKFDCGNDIDNIAREFLNKNAPQGYVFNHGLGHGIGVSVHETPPRLSTKSEESLYKLKDNMCFTIEPGLYKQNSFGVRLENSCYLKDKKIHSFTKMCYEKKLIDYSLLDEQEKVWLNEFEVR